jgi:hypothetical protein
VRLRLVVLVVGLAIALPLLAWTSTFLYWRIRIRSAIRTLEDDAARAQHDAAWNVLTSAGCRALPQIIQSIEPERDQWWIWRRLYKTILDAATTGEAKVLICKEDGPTLDRLEDCFGDCETSVTKRRQRREWILAWWGSEGRRLHQWWRVWSANCSGSR